MGSVVFRLNLLFTRFIDCLVEYKRKKIENEKVFFFFFSVAEKKKDRQRGKRS